MTHLPAVVRNMLFLDLKHPLSGCFCYAEGAMKTFFFYDLETSGLNSRLGRVMQFAGQRTDMDLRPIGEPYNVLVKLSDDILPSPAAVMVTGITPQMTLTDGIEERKFAKLLVDDVFTPETTAVGFNSVRFDDEFVRHTLWRNFHDPYEWAWADGRSRWDLLDVVRMTRALRPDGIEWPVSDDGKPVNKLELITAANGLDHKKAHDALSDVEALIDVARLIKSKQPKLFDYLYELRGKKAVEKLVNLDQPQSFVYASGRYGSEHDFTTVAFPVVPGSKPGAVVVYDLRYDPAAWAGLSLDDVKLRLFGTREQLGDNQRLPFKELSYNKCPAVAPLGVLDDAAQQRLGLSIETIAAHQAALTQATDLLYKVREAYKTREAYASKGDVEERLYDGFLNEKDRIKMAAVRAADADSLADFHPEFSDERLPELLLRYKARQFPTSLSDDERIRWEAYRSARLQAALPGYVKELQTLAAAGADSYLLEELQLWAESIMPASD